MMESDKDLKIKKLIGQIKNCQRCPLHKSRRNPVPGEGALNAKIMLIGEAPGQNEDEEGRPFVGRAGDVLNELLDSIRLKRQDVYICNILKCRPPDNRSPLASEIQSCAGSLDIQIKIINPMIIATLGNFSTEYIFRKYSMTPSKISELHGKIFEVETPLGKKIMVPLFHPAVATYDGNKYQVLLDDFQVISRLMQDDRVTKEGKIL